MSPARRVWRRAAFVSSPQVRARIASGAVAEYAPNDQTDVAEVVAAHPDVLMTGGTDDPA